MPFSKLLLCELPGFVISQYPANILLGKFGPTMTLTLENQVSFPKRRCQTSVKSVVHIINMGK